MKSNSISSPTLGDLVQFVLLNKGDTFKEHQSEQDILWYLACCMNDNCLYYSTDQFGNISGMITAEKNNLTKILTVTENLSMTLQNLKTFARKAKEDFKGYELQWFKRGILKKHNTERVYKKLTL